MTTIAYHLKDNQIAIDSRRTGDTGIIIDNDKKFFTHTDGNFWFACGRVIDIDKLVEAHDGKEFPEDLLVEANAFVVKNGKVYRVGVEEGRYWEELVYFNLAMGSGYQWAMAAMDFDRSAKGAVEYAKTRDYYTGGQVHVFSVETGLFV